MLKNISLNRKLNVVFLLVLIFVTIGFISLSYFHSLHENDSVIVDVAGRNRMLSQRIGFYAEQIVRKHENEKEKKELQELIDLHNTSFYTLKNGGVAPGIANNIVLPASDKQTQPYILSIEELWKKYKENAEIIANEQTPNNRRFGSCRSGCQSRHSCCPASRENSIRSPLQDSIVFDDNLDPYNERAQGHIEALNDEEIKRLEDQQSAKMDSPHRF